MTPQLRWLALAAFLAVLMLALNMAGLGARSTLIPIFGYGGVGGAALAFGVTSLGARRAWQWIAFAIGVVVAATFFLLAPMFSRGNAGFASRTNDVLAGSGLLVEVDVAPQATDRRSVTIWP